jgi:dephospho-CoA kinase
MLRIGLTGGIGSGKTTVCRIFEALGIKVYNADSETKALYQSDPAFGIFIRDTFGESLITPQGPDLKKLGALVFGDPAALDKLNAFVHPRVFAHYENWCSRYAHEPYTVKEAAIMFESGSDKHVHKVVGVLAPDELRISRIRERDGLSEKEIRDRMARQLSNEELASRCDYLIRNDETQSLVEQVMPLHKEFLKLAENYRSYN